MASALSEMRGVNDAVAVKRGEDDATSVSVADAVRRGDTEALADADMQIVTVSVV